MTYASGSTILASDYNGLIGVSPGTTANTLNTVWAVGGTSAGYGQTALANVSIGQTIAAAEWANLINTTANVGTHQGSSLSSVTAPVSGDTVAYLSAIPTNLTTIYTNKLNAATQGSTTANTATYGSTWSNLITFTHTVTFANGDAARYFFNSGGQLKVTCSHPTGTGIDLLLNNLASNVGTIVMSAPASGTATISGTTFNGITKVGGGGTTPLISANRGYYFQTTANGTFFTQTASTGPAGYLSTSIRMVGQSNGTQGSNGDAGSVVTIYTIWDEIPNGLLASTGSATTVTVQAPETTNIANSWGTISVTGTVSGS